MWILSVSIGVTVLLSCVFLLPLLYSIIRRKWILRSLPGLEESVITGHAKHFLNKSPPELLKTIARGFRECGNIWKVFLMHECMVLVADPKILEFIMTSPKHITKSSEYDAVKNWLGDGLIMSKGNKWMGRRKVLTPAFHFKVLDQFIEVFDRNSSIFVNILGKYKETDAVDIYPHITLAALDIICETSMGVSVNSQLNSDSKYCRAVKFMSNVIHLRMFDLILRCNLTYPFTSVYRGEQRAVKVLHDFTDSVIKERREELKEQISQRQGRRVSLENELGMKKKMVLMDVLLQSTIDGKPLTNEDIREEVDNFMFAGHDTTTSGIAFTLFCLAKHPRVQEKVLKEIHEVMGRDKTTPMTLHMLNDLHYLDVVLKEVLRLYPPVPLIGRAIEEDLEINGQTIPAGTNLIIAIMFLHRNPDLFPNPEEFFPERFMEAKSTEEINPYSHIPFSAGFRNCIGQKFALLEIKSMVSKVLRNFEVAVDPGYKEPMLIAEVILKPENGIALNFKPRK